MGRIKSTFVKTSAEQIYDKGGSEFTEDFNKNKQTVKKYANIPSKKLANTIAGYITRLKRRANLENN